MRLVYTACPPAHRIRRPPTVLSPVRRSSTSGLEPSDFLLFLLKFLSLSTLLQKSGQKPIFLC